MDTVTRSSGISTRPTRLPIEFNGTVDLYTGHDEPPDAVGDYVMKDWLCFSSTDQSGL